MNPLGCLKTDPMKNDLVLERIFQFCDVSSLKSCRLVSSKWRDLSLKSWRAKAMMKLSIYSETNLGLEDFLRLIDPEEDDTFQLRKYPFKRYSLEFDKCFPGGEDYWTRKHVVIAISNFRAYHVKISWEAAESFNGLDELLAILNLDSLETLEISSNTMWDEVPASIVPLKCSQLKQLKIYTKNLYGDHSASKSLWPYLLKSFPNLDALTVGYGHQVENGRTHYYSICLQDRLGIVQLLKNLKIPLKEFEMMDVQCPQVDGYGKEQEIMDTSTECKFPLENLRIHVGWHGLSDMLILPLLESCKDTLQYFKASIYFTSESFSDASSSYEDDQERRVITGIKPFKNPNWRNVSMKALNEICLLNGLEWAMFFLPHLDVPNLEKLTVKYEKDRYHEKRRGRVSVSLPPGLVYDKLETFEIYDGQKIPGGNTLRTFARMMPNLTKLTIPLDKLRFPLICRRFRGLKFLNILPGEGDYPELDDVSLTGIFKDGGYPTRKRPSNITDLEHLSDLRISCERQLERDDVKFTEHSVIYGFLQLPRLFNLSIALKEVSEDTMKKLMKHVKGHVDLQRRQRPTQASFFLDIVAEDQSYSCSSSSEENSGAEEDKVDDEQIYR